MNLALAARFCGVYRFLVLFFLLLMIDLTLGQFYQFSKGWLPGRKRDVSRDLIAVSKAFRVRGSALDSKAVPFISGGDRPVYRLAHDTVKVSQKGEVRISANNCDKC